MSLGRSPEIRAYAEREEWRNNVGTSSFMTMIPRRPSSFEDLFSQFQEMIAVVGEEHAPLNNQNLVSLRRICQDATTEYGEPKAFWLMIQATYVEEAELDQQLPPDARNLSEEARDSVDAMMADFASSTDSHRATLPLEVLHYYDNELSIILDIYIPRHHEGPGGFPF